ncbi:MAG: HEAT repeat domain-containing protein [Holophagaceae bacterium]|uniref:HEAT repeat domain-containing protein n=1 Tax=Candidatus Geothrix odensensis TaxID=2954440 RepID=A0A936F587_9BACT|nr:HEAT repeat domain-containing protein [Candidatus Geothrix odensensis]
MNCADLEKHLPNLLAGDLAEGDRMSLQIHLESCPACQEETAGFLDLLARLDRQPLEQPSSSLRERFFWMLEEAAEVGSSRPIWFWRPLTQAAAVLMLVGGGFLGGYLVRGEPDNGRPIGNRNVALMQDGTPSLRMAGIMLLSQGDSEDPAVSESLLGLLDRDPSESVRLAAVDALYLYGRRPQVRDRLAASLPKQTSPRVQLALVDLLGGLREQRALEALRALASAPGTSPEVARRVRARLAEPPL